MTFEGCVPRAVFAGKNTKVIYPNPHETVIIVRMLLTALEYTFQRQLRPTLFSTNIGL